MDYLVWCSSLTLLVLIGLALWATTLIQHVTIFQHERGMRYRSGQFQRVLNPGSYWLVRWQHTIRKVDMRTRFVTVPGQEVLTADHIAVRISLVAQFHVADPMRAINETENFESALYLLIQLALREIITGLAVDDLLAQRQEIGVRLAERCTPQVAEIGLTLVSVGVKDITFPGELKQIFAKIVNARKEGQAALERARAESAALRNLANAAQLLEKNPGLFQLRLLQTLSEGSHNSIILNPTSTGKEIKSESGAQVE